jgi:hypothetical protein
MQKKVLLGCATLVTVGILAYVYGSADLVSKKEASTQQAIPYASETTLPTVDASVVTRTYHSTKELFSGSEIIAIVKVQDQEIVNINESTVNTKSRVSVQQVLKGDQVPDTLTISELGGPVDFSKIPDIGKKSDGKVKKLALE